MSVEDVELKVQMLALKKKGGGMQCSYSMTKKELEYVAVYMRTRHITSEAQAVRELIERGMQNMAMEE